ncbi:MAG: PVC-type heme-binding CxxCH protein [Verrucomicrobiia bacterium]
MNTPPSTVIRHLPTFFVLLLATSSFGQNAKKQFAEPDPQVIAAQQGVSISLVAEHPTLATPTGIDVDEQGRVWLVSCHTHVPPKDYAGPKFDEILIFDKKGNRSVFYNATHHTMDLELGENGWVYLAERDRIFRIKDSDGDGKGDVEENLVVMTSEETYPHNGLSGLGWHPNGDLYFALGENFAKPWSLKGTDEATLSGNDKGGVFHCGPDGTKLHRMARGMWNPFGLCVRSDGEVFVTDNDPGERPPCRLLHVVEGGDYGYRRIYGGEAHHPFVCWNGELRGSLPMTQPTGEAPCGVVPLGRGLLVPSWSDHRIDFFPLNAKGASFSAERITLVQGGRFFRPTCIAADKSLPANSRTRTWYLTDWVDGRYPVHGYGRLWRLDVDLDKASWVGPLDLLPPNKAALLAKRLRDKGATFELAETLSLSRNDDPFIANAALLRLSWQAAAWKPNDLRQWTDVDRISGVLALKLAKAPPEQWVAQLLADPNPHVQFETLRWISDQRLTSFLPNVETFLKRSDLDFQLFESAIATKNTLSGKPEKGVRDTELLLARVQDKANSPRLRAFALRLLPGKASRAATSASGSVLKFPKQLSLEAFQELLAVNDPQLTLETVRALAGDPALGRTMLIDIASDTTRPAILRAEAIAGLAGIAGPQLDLLIEFTGNDSQAIREEALRALRNQNLSKSHLATLRLNTNRFPNSRASFNALLNPASLAEGRPSPEDINAWSQRLTNVPGRPDPENGRRIFHHSSVALCARCHRHSGRGNIVGPDLSAVSARNARRWLLESTLQPNREIAPEYLPRAVTLNDGTVATGIRLRSWTREQLRDANGHTLTFDTKDVASIQELTTSFMPAGLVHSLTDRELRDLIAFLELPQ